MLPMHHPLECQKHTLLRPLRYVSREIDDNHKDKTVIIWTQTAHGQPWQQQPLKSEPFPDTVWRVSWSLSGGILAISCGDNKVSLLREGLKGDWESVHQVE